MSLLYHIFLKFTRLPFLGLFFDKISILKVVKNMQNEIVKKIKNDFSDMVDLVIKPIKVSLFNTIYVIYLESVTGSDKVNDYILKNVSFLNAIAKNKIKDLPSLIPAPNTKILKSADEIEFYLTNGFTIVVHKKEIIALETRADIARGIPEPTTEQSVFGPKDAFTENIQINLGLLKRRLKSKDLKTKSVVLGRKTKTMIEILYFEDICEEDLVSHIEQELKKIDVDGILDSGNISEYLSSENTTHFPTIVKTERPDTASKALLEGKVLIFVDTSPFALILPGFFADFINPISDNYKKSNNINFLKILRFACFFLTILSPAIYIALINYNPETIPTSLLINFSTQRDNVPFPAIVEAIMMLFIYEILRESDVRFPNSYGSAISILGALILGEAAVNAGFVSPIMIIVIAFTFITSLIFTEQEIVNAARHFRIIFLLAAAFYGLYGIVMDFLYFLSHVTELKTMGKPYFYPIAPFDKIYLLKGLLKTNITKDTKRSSLLTHKNKTKQRRNEG